MTNKPKKPEETTFRAERPPAVLEDKKDDTLCSCNGGLPRWYAGDGVAAQEGGVTFYHCRACGKKYAA